MHPSFNQLQTLKQHFKFHTDGYESSVLYLKLAPLWLASLLGTGVGYWMLEYQDRPDVGWCLIGCLAMANYISLKSIWRFSRFWPVYDEIVDWERVDRLLRDSQRKLPPR